MGKPYENIELPTWEKTTPQIIEKKGDTKMIESRDFIDIDDFIKWLQDQKDHLQKNGKGKIVIRPKENNPYGYGGLKYTNWVQIAHIRYETKEEFEDRIDSLKKEYYEIELRKKESRFEEYMKLKKEFEL